MIIYIIIFILVFLFAVMLPGIMYNFQADKKFETAEEDYKRGKIPEAELKLKDIVSKNPAHTKSRWLLQKIYQELGRVEDAIVQLKSMIKYNNFNDQITEYVVRKDLAELSEKAGDIMAALEQYEQIIKTFPDDMEVLSRRGEISLVQEDLPRALSSYQKLVELDPENYQYQLKLGDILTQLNNHHEALECYDRAYILNHDIDIAMKLCTALTNLNRVQDAVNIYEELISQNEGDIPNLIRYRLALGYYNIGNYSNAITQLQIIAGKLSVEEINDGMEKDIIYMLSECYFKLNKEDDAKRYLKKLYNIDREYRDVAKKLKDFGDFVSDEEILIKFYNLRIYEFEELTKKIIVEKLKYSIRNSNIIDDSAVNIVADKDDQKYLIFVRRWKNDVGQLPLKDMHIMLTDFNCDGGLFICTSRFNRSSKEYLKIVKVINTIDGEELAEILREMEFF